MHLHRKTTATTSPRRFGQFLNAGATAAGVVATAILRSLCTASGGVCESAGDGPLTYSLPLLSKPYDNSPNRQVLRFVLESHELTSLVYSKQSTTVNFY